MNLPDVSIVIQVITASVYMYICAVMIVMITEQRIKAGSQELNAMRRYDLNLIILSCLKFGVKSVIV